MSYTNTYQVQHLYADDSVVWSVSIAVLVLSAVVDLRRGADVLAPVACPVVVLCGYLRWSLGVAADRHTVDQTAYQCQEPKYQENDAEDPEIRKS